MPGREADRGTAIIMSGTGMIAEHVGWLPPSKRECHLPSLVRQADKMMAVRQPLVAILREARDRRISLRIYYQRIKK